MLRIYVRNLVKKNCRLFSVKVVPNQEKTKVNSQVENPLTDLFGRHHTYLRISLSERCNLRFNHQHRNPPKVPNGLPTTHLLFNTQPIPTVLRPYSTNQPSQNLNHIDSEGKATMVDVTDKSSTIRTAKARGTVRINYQTTDLIKEVAGKKGDVLSVAQLAGIMGAKKTPELIPLCHNITLTKVDVDVRLNYEKKHIEIEATVRSEGKTGVEMEALTAVSVTALTVYDMCKSVSHDIVISDISLVSKTGGKSDNHKEPIVLRKLSEEPFNHTEIRVGVV